MSLGSAAILGHVAFLATHPADIGFFTFSGEMVAPAFKAFFLTGLIVTITGLWAVGLIVTFFAAFETTPLSGLVITGIGAVGLPVTFLAAFETTTLG